jgi:predicted O-methyltransferase YrrM
MTLARLTKLVERTAQAGRPWEGSADHGQLLFLKEAASSPLIRTIGEIGFNSGISSYNFLLANPKANVISFDLGEYDYVSEAKKIIDEAFPGRHTLIRGDSTETVSEFRNTRPKVKFDLIFLDGGHSYDIAMADLLNMKPLAKSNTVLVFDDVIPWKPWGVGPTAAWTEALNRNVVVQQALFQDGREVESCIPPGDRCWAVGEYVI